MGMFASWSLIGNLALMGVTQGLNMLLNVFFGPAINAARGIAVQVQGAVQQFANNFQTAINPQITKSYASNDFTYMHSLICKGAKFSFFMVFLLSLPVLVMADQTLSLWLKTPPAYAAFFLKIILIVSMVDSLANPLNNAVNASGKIRSYQLTNGLLMLMVLPVGYLALKVDLNPNLVFICQLAMTVCALFFKLFFAKRRTRLSLGLYVKKVLYPVMLVAIISPILPYLMYTYMEHNVSSFVVTGFLCLFSTSVAIYLLGLEKSEKTVIISKLISLTRKIHL